MDSSSGVNQRNLIYLLITIIVFLGGTVAYLLIANKAEAPAQITANQNMTPNLPAQTAPSINATQTAPQNLPAETAPAAQNNSVYTNTDYGFQITIPSGYPDWKEMVEKDYGGKGISYIYIIFKSKDPNWSTNGEQNFVTHEKFPGYASIFSFTAWTKDAYAKAVADCKKDPNPGCPATILGQNSQYVIDVSLGNGNPPKDLESLRKLLDSKDIGKILQFKVLDK